MNRTQKLKTLGFALLSVLIIAAIGVYYIASVRRSMRNQSVTDVLEVTAQGSHAFDVYAAKDAEILHSLTFIMEKEESDDHDEISGRLSVLGESENDYFVIDMDDGDVFSNRSADVITIDGEALAFFAALGERGVCECLPDGMSCTAMKDLILPTAIRESLLRSFCFRPFQMNFHLLFSTIRDFHIS